MGLTVAPVDGPWHGLPSSLWVLVFTSKREKHSLPCSPASPAPLLPTLGNWLSRFSSVVDHWGSSDDLDGSSLVSLAIALFCLIFIILWGAALVAIWAVCMAVVGRGASVLIRVFIGVALWCGLEARSAGPLWWTSLSYTQSPHNLAILPGQLSDLAL